MYCNSSAESPCKKRRAVPRFRSPTQEHNALTSSTVKTGLLSVVNHIRLCDRIMAERTGGRKGCNIQNVAAREDRLDCLSSPQPAP
jgi:hypothetical protein